MTPSQPGYDSARPCGGQRFTSTVHQYLRTWVNSWASNQHGQQATSNPTGHCHRITTVTENPLGRSKTWAEAQVWNSLRFSCALWSANLLHHVWRSCEFLVLLLIRLFNYKAKFITFLKQLKSIQLKDLLWVILLIETSIQLIWGSANESRTIVVTCSIWYSHDLPPGIHMIFRLDAGGLLTIKRTRTLENFRLVLWPKFCLGPTCCH